MRNKEKLLPCPFCGGPAGTIKDKDGAYMAHCIDSKCIAFDVQAFYTRREYANQAWNNRKGQQSNSWISCDDRLPPPPEGGIPRSRAELENAYVKDAIKEYIVMIESAVEPTTLFYGGENRWYDFNGKEYEVYSVVAWQPLPEPYNQAT